MSVEQPPLFDMAQAVAAGERGMELARGGDRNKTWQIRASAWLDRLPSGTEFTTDDLQRDIGKPAPDDDDPANKRNVVGAWTRVQSQQGRIRWVKYVRSASESRHAGAHGLWRKV